MDGKLSRNENLEGLPDLTSFFLFRYEDWTCEELL